MSTNGYPKARHDGLVVRELEDEVLVYDLERHEAHCLNTTAAAVWRRCDGATPAATIAMQLSREVGAPVDEDVVWLALDEVSKLHLLETPVVRTDAALSRAQVLRRAGVVAAAVALPAALSLQVPSASAAVCQGACTSPTECPATCPNCVSNTCQA